MLGIEQLPGELATIILAATPIVELRGAIPLAMEIYHFSILKAALLSIFGTMIPAFFVMYLFEYVYRFLSKHSRMFKYFFEWLFDKTRKKFVGKQEVYGDAALIILAAIPLPLFGSWTAAAAAWLFGIPPKKAIPFIFIGVVIMAIMVTLLTVGVGAVLR